MDLLSWTKAKATGLASIPEFPEFPEFPGCHEAVCPWNSARYSFITRELMNWTFSAVSCGPDSLRLWKGPKPKPLGDSHQSSGAPHPEQ